MEIYNASGHPINQEGITILSECAVPNADLANPKSVCALAEKIAIEASIYALRGVPIALPGMTTLSAMIISIVQGITGYLPRIVWAARKDGMFVWSEEQVMDLHELRNRSREKREVDEIRKALKY